MDLLLRALMSGTHGRFSVARFFGGMRMIEFCACSDSFGLSRFSMVGEGGEGRGKGGGR